jgi:hypothetical protein
MTETRYSVLAIILAAAVTTACSEGVARHSITGPSSSTDNALTVSPALTADRTTSSRAASAGEVAAWAASHGWSPAADGIVVEATESITAISGTCPAASITVRGVPVTLTSTTTFTAPLTCETLAVGDTVKVTALLTYTDTGFTVTATNIAPAGDDSGTGGGGEPGSPGPGGGGKKARGEGVIGAITGSCPTLTLVITGTRVSTTATTEFVNGTCESLRPGTKVTIDGELKPGGEAVAEKIEIRGVPGRKVSGDGKVDAVGGSCPSLELTVRGVKVTTTSETTFTGGVCGDIRAGSHIDVTGDYDGTEVAATALHIKKK